MSAARPLSLDALRRLIADNDYWNPHSPQYRELQHKVSKGFASLYPAPPEQEPEDDRARTRDELNARWAEIRDEYNSLFDDFGNSQANVRKRFDELRKEKSDLESMYKRYGETPPFSFNMRR
jgi:hypothetical protein